MVAAALVAFGPAQLPHLDPGSSCGSPSSLQALNPLWMKRRIVDYGCRGRLEFYSSPDEDGRRPASTQTTVAIITRNNDKALILLLVWMIRNCVHGVRNAALLYSPKLFGPVPFERMEIKGKVLTLPYSD